MARRLALSFGAAGLLLFLLFVFGGVDVHDVLQTLARLSPAVYALALGLHLVTTVGRALRFQLLIPADGRPGFRHALSIAAAHNMASYVLPLKAGEASLVVYLKLQCGTPAGVALAALLVSRFLDAAALCAGLAAACFGLRDAGAAPRWMGSAALALVGLAAAFLLLSLRGDLLVRALEAGLRWLRVQRVSLGQRLLVRTNGLALALRAASGGRRLAGAALLTAPMWFTIFGFYAVLARAFGIPESVGFLERAFGASLAALFNLLPLNAAAGAGTQELGWVTGFHVVLGVDQKLALTSGVGVHLVQLFNVVAMGLAAHLAMGILPRLHLAEEPAPRRSPDDSA
jgi:uncharacterized protein (TIRG00374 family)